MNRLIQVLLYLIPIASTLVRAEELKYSIVPDFFEQNPGGQPLGPCHGGAVIDKAGNIYVSTDTPRGIVVFSRDGKFLRTCGPTRIHGLEIRQEHGVEFIYAARPSDHELTKLKLTGEVEWTLEYPKESGL